MRFTVLFKFPDRKIFSGMCGVGFLIHRRDTQANFALSPREFYDENSQAVPHVPHHELQVTMPLERFVREAGYPTAVGTDGKIYVPYPLRMPTVEVAVEQAKLWAIGYVLVKNFNIGLTEVLRGSEYGLDYMLVFARRHFLEIDGTMIERRSPNPPLVAQT